ncbi:MAG: hypothetical protein ABIP61_02105, partial [Burkholderiaceae bacterium]
MRGVGATLLALGLLVAAAAAALVWTLRSERGTAWLLSALPGVQAEGPKGALLGDFEVERLTVTLPDASALALAGLGWSGLNVERGTRPLWIHVRLADLHARRVDLTPGPGPKAPSQALQKPAGLALPIEVEIGMLRIGELHLAALGTQPLRDLQARIHLSASGGREHRIEQVSLAWDLLRLSANARVVTHAPMALDVQARLAPSDAASATLPAWSATLALAGPLDAPALQADLRASAGPTQTAQTLALQATLHPFAAWPIGALHASTQGLDLSALASTLPATSLSGQAVVTSQGREQPATVSIELKNAQPGRWNEGRLPLRTLALDVAGRPDDVDNLSLRRLDVELGTPRTSAGRITGEGHWTRDRWDLEAALHGVQPDRLDARAAALELSGPVRLSGRGFGGAASDGASVDVKAELSGTLGPRGPVRAVKLALDGRFNAQRIELHQFLAQAGNARAALSGQFSRAAATAPWVVKAEASLVDFDPTVWWVGRSAPTVARGPSRLNAKASINLSVPPAALAGPLAALPAALRGPAGGMLANITLAESVLAGVPLHGTATLAGSGDGSQALPTLTLDAGGNRVHAEARLATRGPGASDTLDLRVDAAALERLAPLLDLFQVPGATAGLAGRLSASARITGRWPEIASEGRLEASALRVGAAGVQQAQARWSVGTAAGAPLDASASLAQATWAQGGKPTPVLESAQLRLTGTARAHALELSAISKALPPAWTEILQPLPPGAGAGAGAPITGAGAQAKPGTRTETAGAAPAPAPVASSPAASTRGARTTALLRARGGLVETGTLGISGWRGSVEQIELRRNVAAGAPLLSSANMGLEFMWAGGPARVTVQPGRADVLGGVLRWSRIAWQAATGPGGFAQIDAEAEIEPLRVAPLLARVQADFGWGGDLSVGGHLKLHSAPTFSADVVLERRGGDLTVTDELGTQALGLTDLRLALNAENGVWSFTQALAGKTLGVAAGAVVARTSPQASWPAANTPIEGVLELQVASLGTWGNWVPPGWRLDGALRASASIGGSFGAPEYTGEVRGTRLAARNFLQGVNVTDGDVSISLRCSTARIEHFRAKAGNGTLRLE